LGDVRELERKNSLIQGESAIDSSSTQLRTKVSFGVVAEACKNIAEKPLEARKEEKKGKGAKRGDRLALCGRLLRLSTPRTSLTSTHRSPQPETTRGDRREGDEKKYRRI